MLIDLKLEFWDEAIIWIFNNYVMIKRVIFKVSLPRFTDFKNN